MTDTADVRGNPTVAGSGVKPRPLDPPMVPFAVGGMVIWAVAALTAVIFRDWLHGHGHGSWLPICVAGFLIGIPGLLTMIRYDARRSTRRGVPPGPGRA